eukprot:TRINITY_DN72348_c0_g1_i1.p1 TRINITY_DN72348_c0_g1~~TRINITY_DN72348_c0_g1_i1.p1  ORF type:complete len:688 (+),score=61.94 TRINITY_DN72348_c0_g1_i1:61-2124(+)
MVRKHLNSCTWPWIVLCVYSFILGRLSVFEPALVSTFNLLSSKGGLVGIVESQPSQQVVAAVASTSLQIDFQTGKMALPVNTKTVVLDIGAQDSEYLAALEASEDPTVALVLVNPLPDSSIPLMKRVAEYSMRAPKGEKDAGRLDREKLKQVSLVRAAVGEQEGYANLSIGTSASSAVIKIPIITLDGLLGLLPNTIPIEQIHVKVRTGGEYVAVLKGAAKNLPRVDTFIFECNSDLADKTLRDDECMASDAMTHMGHRGFNTSLVKKHGSLVDVFFARDDYRGPLPKYITENNITHGYFHSGFAAFTNKATALVEVNDKLKTSELDGTDAAFESAGSKTVKNIFKHTRSSLLRAFNETSFEVVTWNNWNMGCTDLAVAASYFRAISDRLHKSKKIQEKLLIFDIGANNGQDAANIFGAFHKIEGMCKGFNVPYHLISIEPSPKVFCELQDVAHAKKWPGNHLYHFLNVAVSDSTGNLKFLDPGNEGGRLVDSSSAEKHEEMTAEEFQKAQQCWQSANQTAVKIRKEEEKKGNKQEQNNGQVDHAVVPTYTMDLLVSSLVKQGVASTSDKVFILKIDTEGHDVQVIKGSSSLLDQKRIIFVLFEVSTNARIKEVAEFMRSKGYLCFMLTPKQLVPVDGKRWWYSNLEATMLWWGNGFCGIRGSDSLAMFWRMYHSDALDMVDAFELL